MRSRMSDVVSYAPSVKLGERMTGDLDFVCGLGSCRHVTQSRPDLSSK
jgi:hypothetical protein